MEIELLVVPDCPHEVPAAQLLRQAFDDIGLAHVGYTVIVIHTEAEAERRRFIGSPTFSVHGIDLFPSRVTPMRSRAASIQDQASFRSCTTSGVPSNKQPP